MIEVFTEALGDSSIAERSSTTRIQVDGPDAFSTGDFRLYRVDGRYTFSRMHGDGPLDQAGTVSIGDKLLVDGEIYTVSARQLNTPVLVKADS